MLDVYYPQYYTLTICMDKQTSRNLLFGISYYGQDLARHVDARPSIYVLVSPPP